MLGFILSFTVLFGRRKSKMYFGNMRLTCWQHIQIKLNDKKWLCSHYVFMYEKKTNLFCFFQKHVMWITLHSYQHMSTQLLTTKIYSCQLKIFKIKFMTLIFTLVQTSWPHGASLRQPWILHQGAVTLRNGRATWVLLQVQKMRHKVGMHCNSLVSYSQIAMNHGKCSKQMDLT